MNIIRIIAFVLVLSFTGLPAKAYVFVPPPPLTYLPPQPCCPPKPTNWAAVVKESVRRGTVELLEKATKKLYGRDIEKWKPILERLSRGAKKVDVPATGRNGLSHEMGKVLAIYMEFAETDTPETLNAENLPPWFLNSAKKLYIADTVLAGMIGVSLPDFENFALDYSGLYKNYQNDFKILKILGMMVILGIIISIVLAIRNREET